ncbi:hypothetical protein SAMN02745166_04779 [Prosthecobacter debontii]|uniref:Uncharacterized protein n=1 Tax=Prosthecobacter debontii TaxID=48467 RepID=A0A1T4Z2H2_9BACT|nr:hypothetical protein SAMN02745166_04779 [Prosthecobacter debontii]
MTGGTKAWRASPVCWSEATDFFHKNDRELSNAAPLVRQDDEAWHILPASDEPYFTHSLS